MAHLLGNQDCMDSLRKDITDLQGAIIDAFSRVGAVRYPSWKFPDKVSCDLDLVMLLERYDFVASDPEFTQHSHIVLLELVIDRLLLLLQTFTHYTEILTSEQNIPASRSVGPSMSVSLTVRKFWNRLLKLGSLYQQAVSEKNAYRQEVSKSQARLSNRKVGSEQLRNSSSTFSDAGISFRSTTSAKSSHPHPARSPAPSPLDPTALPSSGSSIARDVCSTGCQTIESALVPCDACARTQACLREVSDSIVGICLTQNLPCSLIKFQEAVQGSLGNGVLCATDIAYWASEQSKDLARINKHLTSLTDLINPLKAELKGMEAEQAQLKTLVENFDTELQKERKEQLQKRQDVVNQLEEENKKTLEMVTKLEKDKEEQRKGAAVLEERLSILKEELKAQHMVIRDLEITKEKLLEEMNTKMTDKTIVLSLEEKVAVLNNQLESIAGKLNATSAELDKERAKTESMLRHEESLQAKQRALLQRLDVLDEECEELRNSLSETEDGKAELEEQLKQAKLENKQSKRELMEQQEKTEKLNQEKQNMEQSVSDLQKTVSELKQKIAEQKEKARLLVAFPDLNIPAEAQFESTGNVVVDMEKQLQANIIRISILEEENARLRNSLSRLRQTAEQGSLKLIPQTQLWSSPGGSPEGIQSEHGKKMTHQDDTEETASVSSVSTRITIPEVTATGATSQCPKSMQWDKMASVGGMRRALTNLTIPPHSSAASFYGELRRAGSSPGARTFSTNARKQNRK